MPLRTDPRARRPRGRGAPSILALGCSVTLWAVACTPGVDMTSEPGGETSPAAGARTGAPRSGQELLAEDWVQLRIGDRPAGYAHRTARREDNGDVTSRSVQKLALRRGSTRLEVGVELELRETAGGKIVSMELIQDLATSMTTVSATVRDDRLVVTTAGAGPERTAEVPHDPDARGPYYLDRRSLEALREPGDVFEATAFVPEAQRSTRVRTRAGKRETIEIGGARRELQRRSTTMDLLPGVEFASWVDEEGTTWKATYSLFGQSIEEIRSRREEVLDARLASPPEIFLATSVRPDRPLPDPGNLVSAVYRITLRQGDFSSRGLDDAFRLAGQTLLGEDGPAARRVRIERVEPLRQVRLPVPPRPELEASLAAGPVVESDDPEIRAVAGRILAGTRDAWKAARRLERWVHDHIREKDLQTAFATARETLETARGDCTEHGVLLAALARACGIPARVVTGLVYQEGRFYGHLWTEVYIDRWVPLDATRPAAGVGPTHIALAASDLSSGTGSAALFDLAALIGNIQIEILEP